MEARLSRPVFHAFFGGTFDPPHLAHHEMLKSLLADELLDVVHLVPARLNPHKGSQSGLGSIEDRREWIAIWREELEHELSPAHLAKLKIEGFEIDSDSREPSYTVDTLNFLRERDGGRWILCGGSDLLVGLASWKNVEALLSSLHSFWLFPREGLNNTSDSVPNALRPFCQFRWLGSRVMAVSSTQVREALEASNALQNIERLPLLPQLRRRLAEKLST